MAAQPSANPATSGGRDVVAAAPTVLGEEYAGAISEEATSLLERLLRLLLLDSCDPAALPPEVRFMVDPSRLPGSDQAGPRDEAIMQEIQRESMLNRWLRMTIASLPPPTQGMEPTKDASNAATLLCAVSLPSTDATTTRGSAAPDAFEGALSTKRHHSKDVGIQTDASAILQTPLLPKGNTATHQGASPAPTLAEYNAMDAPYLIDAMGRPGIPAYLVSTGSGLSPVSIKVGEEGLSWKERGSGGASSSGTPGVKRDIPWSDLLWMELGQGAEGFRELSSVLELRSSKRSGSADLSDAAASAFYSKGHPSLVRTTAGPPGDGGDDGTNPNGALDIRLPERLVAAYDQSVTLHIYHCTEEDDTEPLTRLSIVKRFTAGWLMMKGTNPSSAIAAARTDRKDAYVETVHVIFPSPRYYQGMLARVRGAVPGLKVSYRYPTKFAPSVLQAAVRGAGGATTAVDIHKTISVEEIELCEEWHIPPAVYLELKRSLLSSRVSSVQAMDYDWIHRAASVGPGGGIDTYRGWAIVDFMQRKGWVLPHTLYFVDRTHA